MANDCMKKLVVCNCITHQRISYAKVRSFLSSVPKDYKIELVPDLCGMAVCEGPKLVELCDSDFIVACHPRAVCSLFNFAGCKLPLEKVIDLREKSPKEALKKLVVEVLVEENLELDQPKWDNEWTPWNPVIDYDRCVNCGKCADFCLFGVYDFSDGKIKVSSPQNCKTNCPACARICPKSAIIFPKYDKSPINGGDAIEEKLPVDPSEIRRGNTYEQLANRRRSKRKLLKDEL